MCGALILTQSCTTSTARSTYYNVPSPANILGTPVQLMDIIASQLITWQQLNAFIHSSSCGEDHLLKVKLRIVIRMGKKGDLSYCEMGVVVAARRAGVSTAGSSVFQGLQEMVQKRESFQ
ncbi:hypothetical protein ILYODFUR_026997 [Ilyodon furcidens]|uniref:Uncharacterized protein n=1 Tax=Ilyodon furcidens TaxID=33524 RepID=A0ABV0U8V3_9TELE